MRIFGPFAILSSLILAAACTTPYQRAAYYPGNEVISSPGYSAATTALTGDAALESQLRQALDNSGLQFASGVNVAVQNGIATLTGSIPSDADRQAVDTLVRNTTGVSSVVDQLQIVPPGGQIGQVQTATTVTTSPADESLRQRIQQTIENDPQVSAIAPNVNISVQDGRIALTGTVASTGERQQLDNLVRNIPGVTAVYDQMQVSAAAAPTGRPGAPIYSEPQGATISGGAANMSTGDIFNLHVQGLNQADRSLAQQILQGLQTDTLLATLMPNVTIHVSGGRVILQGTVQSEAQRQAIAATVQRAAGVNNVENQLQVRSGQ